MKKLILLIALMAGVRLFAGDPTAKVLFDCANITGDTVKAVYIKGDDLGLVMLDFTDLSCDSAKMKVGISLVDTAYCYPASISGLTNPITLNKLATDPNDASDKLFTHSIWQTKSGVKKEYTRSTFYIEKSEWRAYYMIFNLQKRCTSGNVYIIQK